MGQEGGRDFAYARMMLFAAVMSSQTPAKMMFCHVKMSRVFPRVGAQEGCGAGAVGGASGQGGDELRNFPGWISSNFLLDEAALRFPCLAGLDWVLGLRISHAALSHWAVGVLHAHDPQALDGPSSLAIICAWVCMPQGTQEELMALPHGSYDRLVAQSRDQQQHGEKSKR